MKKGYLFFRIGGYVCGLLGMMLFVTGRQTPDPASALKATGGILIIIGFVSFFLSYILYTILRLGRR